MDFHFKQWLEEELVEYTQEYSFTFDVEWEQDFIKMSTCSPSTIYVVIKKLQDSKVLDVATNLPLQIMILCEENTMNISQEIFNDIANKWNMKFYSKNGTYVKFTFSNPVVLNNFNDMFAGYRSLLYMTCTLFIMENIADITDVKIDNEKINLLGYTLAYTMSTDTQQRNRYDNQNYIGESVKNTSVFSINMNIILKSGDFLTKITNIVNETSDGNDTFVLSFKLNNVTIEKNVKLTAFTMNTAPNAIPTTQIGMMK